MHEIVFYHIPISHFCEKIHWALDYKAVPYRTVCVNPYTRKELASISEHNQVPVIRHGDRVVCDSSEIVTYLDEICPEPPLVPPKEPERRDCLEIEQIADEEVGPAVRRVAYGALFHDRAMFGKVMLPKKGLGRMLNPARRPIVTLMLKWHFGISRRRLSSDRCRLEELLAELQGKLGQRGHFIGESLTIADIAVASLLNPLEIVREFSESQDFSPIFGWMRTLRTQHGRKGWKR